MMSSKILVNLGYAWLAVVACAFSASAVQAQPGTSISLRATLNGSVGKVAISGKAEYTDHGANQRSLKVELNQLPYANGTMLGIKVAGIGPVGFFMVESGKATFFAQTNPQDPILGDPVNITHSGDSISIHLVPVGAQLGASIATGSFH